MQPQANSGIYITQWSDGFRLAQVSAVEKLNALPRGSEAESQEYRKIFRNSPTVNTKDEAILQAHKDAEKLALDGIILDRGVTFLGKAPCEMKETSKA
jgi:hypothetical protein